MVVQIQEQEEHAVNYQPILSDDKKDEYWVVIVLRPGLGLPMFSKGSQFGQVTNDYEALPALSQGDIVIFNGNLYRHEPAVQGKGCMAVLLSYC